MNKIDNRLVTTIVLLAILALFASPFANAQGLVPCGGTGEPPCSPCHIFVLVQNIYNFIIFKLAPPIAALMFVYGGFLMVVPGFGGEKSAAALTKGKKVITNTLIGLAIIFFAWLGVDTIIKILVGKQDVGSGVTAIIRESRTSFGPWNVISCSVPTQSGQKTTATTPTDSTKQEIDTKAEQQKDLQAILGQPKPSNAEIQKQALDLFAKFPGSFSTSGDCGGNNNADGTLRAIAQGQFPPVCAPDCSCKEGGTSGTINLDSRLLALVDRTLDAYKGRVQINSLTTGKHGADSKHYQGLAADFKVIDPKLSYKELFAFLNSRLGPDTFLQCEIKGKNSSCEVSGVDHIHAQYNR